jgi:hypothetical protein
VQHPHHRHRSSWDLLGRSGPERDWTGRSYDELRTAKADKEARRLHVHPRAPLWRCLRLALRLHVRLVVLLRVRCLSIRWSCSLPPPQAEEEAVRSTPSLNY